MLQETHRGPESRVGCGKAQTYTNGGFDSRTLLAESNQAPPNPATLQAGRHGTCRQPTGQEGTCTCLLTVLISAKHAVTA